MISAKQFIAKVYEHYRTQGRHSLPWRHTKDPYAILVSEIMLQQTQVDRVIPKYEAFMTEFPTIADLAQAPLGDVLRLWQGLGYNRRAKMLHECARELMKSYNGEVPSSEAVLVSLPGIGPYTARAVMAFAFGVALPLIETNVRTVYLAHFFPNETNVPDTALFPYVTDTLDVQNPREWYYALMDYGSYLKRTRGNSARHSSTYVRQSTFQGSDRQIRGAILRVLTTTTGTLTIRDIRTLLSLYDTVRVEEQLAKLQAEGMVVYQARRYSLPI